jgi:hypothetical protein
VRVHKSLILFLAFAPVVPAIFFNDSGCPPIRKQSFQNSGFRDVADPRYQSYDFSRQTTISCDFVRSMVAVAHEAYPPLDSISQNEQLWIIAHQVTSLRPAIDSEVRRKNQGQEYSGATSFRPIRGGDTFAYRKESSNALAAFRSAVSNPSLNRS